MIPEFDKYAPFIWSAYGISALVLALLVIHNLRGRKK